MGVLGGRGAFSGPRKELTDYSPLGVFDFIYIYISKLLTFSYVSCLLDFCFLFHDFLSVLCTDSIFSDISFFLLTKFAVSVSLPSSTGPEGQMP